MKINVQKHNSSAWDKQVESKNEWTVPVSHEETEAAKRGEAKIMLTPVKQVPAEWYGDVKGKNLLCLASGGGQQGPLFSAMGADVTVFDNSEKQLEQDRYVARRDNLKIKTAQGDMRDLSAFKDGSFDMIFHPVSNTFVPDILPVWRECARVLKKGGVLMSGFVNPLIYMFDAEEYGRTKKLTVKYKIPYSDTEQLNEKQLEERIKNNLALEYSHTLEEQINGQLESGFVLTAMYEDGYKEEMLDSYINTYMATRAVKTGL